MLKVLIIFVILFSTNKILASSEDLKDLSLNELIILAGDVSQIRLNDGVKDEEVTFYLAVGNSQPVLLTEPNKTVVGEWNQTKFLVHGWLENHRRLWYEELTGEYLKLGVNVIQVDWERPARSSYTSSAINTRLVGENIAQFILRWEIPLDQTHIIGHSLGAHVAGFAGKAIQKHSFGKKIARITALDPAGPYFRNNFITEQDRLSSQDADIVDAIHTDAYFYGYEHPIGTLDVYVNGGSRIQPGCLNVMINSIEELLQDFFCSHARSCVYFTEAVNKGQFVCRKCESWENYITGNCDDGHTEYILQAEDVSKETTDVCYVKTNSKAPFLPPKQ